MSVGEAEKAHCTINAAGRQLCGDCENAQAIMSQPPQPVQHISFGGSAVSPESDCAESTLMTHAILRESGKDQSDLRRIPGELSRFPPVKGSARWRSISRIVRTTVNRVVNAVIAGYENYDADYAEIAGTAQGEAAEQGCDLIIEGRGNRCWIARRLASRKTQGRDASANGCALEPDQQETLLEFGCNEAGFSAHEMQHFDDVPVAGHRATGGER
jgi:hypothetical protein